MHPSKLGFHKNVFWCGIKWWCSCDRWQYGIVRFLSLDFLQNYSHMYFLALSFMLSTLCAVLTLDCYFRNIIWHIRPDIAPDTMKSMTFLLVASLSMMMVSGRRGLLMTFNCVKTNFDFILVPDDDKYSENTAAPRDFRLAYDCNEEGLDCSLKTWVWVMCVFIPLFFISLCLLCLCCGWFTCACLTSTFCCCCCCIEWTKSLVTWRVKCWFWLRLSNTIKSKFL